MQIDPEVMALFKALPEEGRQMVYLIFEDVATGEMEPEEGLKNLIAVLDEYSDKLIQ